MKASSLEIARDLVSNVGEALATGKELYSWWRRSESEGRLLHIPLVRQLNKTLPNYGFLGEAPLRGGLLPVLGVVQRTFYDRMKISQGNRRNDIEWYRSQLAAFVMRYFLNLSWMSNPYMSSTFADTEGHGGIRRGWRYSQILYKLRTGAIGEFVGDDQYRMVDLREIGSKYEWIILRANIYNMILKKDLFGGLGPQVDVPLVQDVYAVMSPTFVVHQKDPRPGVLGEYGYGYSVISMPEGNSVFAYGPDRLIAGFEFIHFQLMDTGEVWVEMAFVANQPNRIVNFKPVEWGFGFADVLSLGLASEALSPLKNYLRRFPFPRTSPVFSFIDLMNTLTGGIAERQFCLSQTRVLRDVMALHCLVLDNFIVQTIPTWSQVPNWTAGEKLLDWASTSTVKQAAPASEKGVL